MKPTSPEDRELDALAADLSAAYRKDVGEQPPARLDALILEAARQEAARPRKRNWHLPASIAAMLVIGVSLALMTSEIEDPLPPLDPSQGRRTGGAEPAANTDASSESAMKVAPEAARAPELKSAPQFERDVIARPSRERSARPEGQTGMGASAPAVPVEEPAGAVPRTAPAKDFVQSAPAPVAEALGKKEALVDSVDAPRTAEKAVREEETAASAAVPQTPASPPGDWLNRIENLLRDGKVAEAQQELARFRLQYPDYPLPQRLREPVPATNP